MKYIVLALLLISTAAEARRFLPPMPTPGPIIVPLRT